MNFDEAVRQTSDDIRRNAQRQYDVLRTIRSLRLPNSIPDVSILTLGRGYVDIRGGKEVAHQVAAELGIRLERRFSRSGGHFYYEAVLPNRVLLTVQSDAEGCEVVPIYGPPESIVEGYEVRC
jgi:hypothetical protein